MNLEDAIATAAAARKAGDEARAFAARIADGPVEVQRVLEELSPDLWNLFIVLVDLEHSYESAAVAAGDLAARAPDRDEAAAWELVADYCRSRSQ